MVIYSEHIEATVQLEVPVYSADGNAPNEAFYFNDTDDVVKYKDVDGNVHAAGSSSTDITLYHVPTENDLPTEDGPAIAFVDEQNAYFGTVIDQ